MRLGKKKEKTGDAEVGRAQIVDGVSRLICSAKSSHNMPLKGMFWKNKKYIDIEQGNDTRILSEVLADLVPLH